MNKSLSSKGWLLLFFVFIFVFTSCNDTNTKENSATTISDAEKSEPPSASQPASMISGILDSLWVDSAAFAALPNSKLVMSFVFFNNDTLTLHGWSQKNGPEEFDSLPNIKLNKGLPSNLTYGYGTYFGNVRLKQNDINKIQNDLRQKKAKYVIFAPMKNGNNVGYKIYVGTEHPTILGKIMTVTDTNTEANPSPPKNSN